MKKNLIRPLTAGLALALATSFSSGVFAAPEARGDQPAAAVKHGKPGHEHRHGRGEMKRDGLMLPGLGVVPKAQLDALNLNADQQKRVSDLRDAQRGIHEKMRSERDTREKVLTEQLAANKLDPRALSAASEKAHDAFKQDGQKVRDQGFALWDSLNEEQRTKLTAFVRERHEKRAEMKAKRDAEKASRAPATTAS